MVRAKQQFSKALNYATVCLAALAASVSAVAQTTGSAADEEVVVTGNIIEVPRRQVGTAVTVVSGDEITLRGYYSLADVLRTQPAIGVSNTGGVGKATALRIRGEEGYRTTLLIDGVKAVDPSGTQVLPVFDNILATSDVERVEVLRGPQGFIYGADAGGVVNIVTRRGDGPANARLGLEAGEFATRRLNASAAGGSDSFDYYVSLTDLETDGFNARLSDAVLMDDDGAENTTIHARFGWAPTENLSLQMVVRDIDASTQIDGCFHPDTFALTHDCFGDTKHTTYKVSASHQSGQFSNRFGYSEVDIDRENFADGSSSFSPNGTVNRLEYTGSFEASERTTLVYGLDMQNEDVVAGAPRDERDQDGYYFEYQGSFADRFFVTAGARYDDNEDFGSATSTRVSLAYLQELRSGRTIKYRGSYGTGFRPPSIFEIAFNTFSAFPPASNTRLVEEKSSGYDLGLEYEAGNGLRFEITWFDQEIDNAIEFDLVGFSGYLQTPGVSASTGFEVATVVPLGERFELLANATLNDAEDAQGFARVRRPELLANAGLRYTSSSQATRFIANLRASRDAVDVGFVPLDDYEVLDLSVTHRISERLEFFARIENALDENYAEVIDYFTAGRSFYAGVRLQL